MLTKIYFANYGLISIPYTKSDLEIFEKIRFFRGGQKERALSHHCDLSFKVHQTYQL